MKKLMLFVLAALLSFAAAHAQGTATVVVADSTATNSYVPIYGNWADDFLRCQVIYPESMMAELIGSEIQGVTYYLSTPADDAWTGTFNVRIGTTANATFNGVVWEDVSSFDTVYTGTLDGTGSVLTINFSTPFTYSGGNLLIEINQIEAGNYSSCTFYGINSTGSALSNYNRTAWASIAGSQRNFIPKTGFIVSVSCVPPTFSPITPAATTASVDWTEPGTASAWQLKLNDADWFDVTEHPYTITGLTPETAYTLQLRSNCGGGDLSYPVSTSFTTPPTCPAPTDLTATSTENSLTLSWMENGSATEWLMKVNDGAYQTVTNPYTLTGLTANTLYAIEVRAYCGADDTSTAVSRSFRTPCGTMSLPYSESFEGYTAGTTVFPTCWTSAAGTNYVQSGANYASDGINGLHIAASGTVVSPIVNVAGNDVYVSFDLRREGTSSGTVAVGFAASPDMVESAIYIDTIDPADNTFHSYEYTFENTLNIQTACIVFNQTATSSAYYYWLDNLGVSLSGCERPQSVIVSNVTPTTAVVSWPAVDGASSYEVAYGTSSDVNQAISILPTTTNTLSITNLTGETSYHVWVRTICGENRTLWRASEVFTTQVACAQVVNAQVSTTTLNAIAINWSIDASEGGTSTEVEVSYKKTADSVWTITQVTENFFMLTGLDDGTSYDIRIRNICGSDTARTVTLTASTKACGEVAGGTGTSSYIPTYTLYNYSYTQAIYTDAEVGNIDTITGISYNCTSTGTTTRTIDVYIADVAGASLSSGYIPIENFTQVVDGFSWTIDNGWTEIVFDEPFVHQAGHDIVVAIDDNTGSYQSTKYFQTHTGSGRYKYNDGTNYDPTNPPTGSTASTTVPNIRFTTVCHTDGCQTPLAVVGNVTIHEVTVNWTAMGTEASWTVAHRLSGEEEWIVDNNNVTANTYTITGLNAASTYQIRVGANCASDTAFAVVNVVTECDVVPMPYTNGFETYDAGTSSFPQCWTNVSSTSNYVQSGTSYASAGTKGLHMQGPATVATPIIAFGGNDVYVRCDLKRESANYSGDMAIGIAASASAEDIATAIYFDTITGVSASSFNTYELTFENTSNIQNGCIVFNQVNTTSTNYYFWLDELVISEPPTCARPTDLTATATDNSLTLSWAENGTATQWLLKVDTNAWQLVTTNPYTLNGLNANTLYTVSVSALCAGNDTSEAFTASFRTACGMENMPYSESFESYTAGSSSFPPCWTSASGSNYVQTGTDYASDGVNGLHIAGPGVVVSPVLNVAGNNVYVNFDLRREGTSSGKVAVGFATSPDAVDAAVYIDTITPDDNTFHNYEFSFINTLGIQSGCIVFRQLDAVSYYYYWLDNLSVSVLSDCQRPESGYVSDVTPVSAVALWTAATEATAYELVYGTVDDVAQATATLTPTATTATITGLTPNTTYYAWVRTVCGDEYTLWRSLGSFTTEVECAQVLDAHVSSATNNAIAINWTIDSETGYPSTAVKVSYKVGAATEWTDTVVTSSYFMLTGLDEGTTVDFRIRNICSEDTATMVTLAAATTVCNEIGEGSTNSDVIPINAYYEYSYTQAIYTASEVGAIDTINGISYNYNSTATTRTVDVYMANVENASLTNGTLDFDLFTQVASNYSWSLTSGWNEIVFDTPFIHENGQDLVIAIVDNTGEWEGASYFKAHAGSGYYYYQDDESINPSAPSAEYSGAVDYVADIRLSATCPAITCQAPLAAVSDITAHEVSVTWVALGTETSWTVEHRLVGSAEWTTDNNNVTVTNYTVTGLNAGASYQIRVGANCGDETSYATVTALTNCDIMDIAYTEDFNSGVLNPCWAFSSTSFDIEDGQLYNGYISSAVYAVLPQLSTPINELMISFDAEYGGYSGSGTVEIGVVDAQDNTASFVSVETITVGDLALHEVMFNNYAGNGNYIAIKFPTSYSYIDNVVVDLLPTCLRPTAFSVEATTTNSATIAWNHDATNYEIRYRAGAGAWQTATSTTSTATLNNLEPSTNYQVEIRAICSEGDTSASLAGSFTTECDVISSASLPYFEGFENGMGCWEQEQIVGTTEWNFSNTSYTALEGSRFVSFKSSSRGDEARLISPVFNLEGAENVTLKFAHAQKQWTGDQDSLKVEYRLSSSSEWQTLASYRNDITSWSSETISIPEVSSTVQIAFHGYLDYGYGIVIDSLLLSAETPEVPTCDVPTNITTSNLTANAVTVSWTGSAAQYQVEIVGGGQTYTQTVSTNSYTIETLTQETPYTVRVRALCDNGINSDWSPVVNFTTPQPECGVPTNVQTTTTATSVTITWTGYASEYDVKVTGSEIAPINRTVNTNSCTIEDLVPASTYQVIVRAKCNGQYTDWTAPTTFYTADGQGIDDVQGDFSVSLFPNPAKTSVTLKVDGLNGKANVSLIDMSGRTVMTNTLDGNDELQFNVTTLAKGTYFVRINGETISTVRKLVVQ